MQLSEPREFPLADVLSITTPRLLSMRKMQGVCDLVEWMLEIDPIPRMINLREWGRLRTATDIARTSLLRQHPQLRDVQPADDIDQADLLVWLFETERVHGEYLVVEKATVEIEAIRNQVVAAAKLVAEFLQSLQAALLPAFEALARLGEEVRELAETAEDEPTRDR